MGGCSKCHVHWPLAFLLAVTIHAAIILAAELQPVGGPANADGGLTQGLSSSNNLARLNTTRAATQSLQRCISTYVQRFIGSCSNRASAPVNSTSHTADLLPQDELIAMIRTCLNTTQEEGRSKEVKLLIPQGWHLNAIRNIVSVYEKMTGQPFLLDTPNAEADYLPVILSSITNAANLSLSHHVWHMQSNVMGEAVEQDAVKDLTDVVLTDSRLQWTGLLPAVKTAGSLHDSKVVGLAWNAITLSFLYRRDLFARYGWPIPRTWEELIALGRSINGTQGMVGFCGGWGQCDVYANYLHRSVISSMIQTHTVRSGWLIDPDSMRLLLDSPALTRTMEIIWELHSISKPLKPNIASCNWANLMFMTGRCISMIGPTALFKFISHQTSFRAFGKGKLGVASLPGSTVVLDRDANVLVPCTPQRCPHGTRFTLDHGTEQLVNVAPIADFTSLSINKHAPPEEIYYSFSLSTYMTSPDTNDVLVFKPENELGPLREQQLQPQRWAAAGYDLRDSQDMCAAHLNTLTHPNLAVPISIPGASRALMAVSSMYASLLNTNDSGIIPELAARVVEKFREVLYNGRNPQALKLDYWMSLNRDVSSLTSTDAQQPVAQHVDDSHDNDPVPQHVVIALCTVLPAVSLLLLAALAVRTWRKAHRRQGPIGAPGQSPLTTLLVSDIENSTVLWEEITAAHMDAALKLHNACIRSLAAKYRGYESAWEGDSFIIAFHNPQDSLGCASDLQLELLRLPWPPALLESPLAAEVWVKPAHKQSHKPWTRFKPVLGAKKSSIPYDPDGYASPAVMSRRSLVLLGDSSGEAQHNKIKPDAIFNRRSSCEAVPYASLSGPLPAAKLTMDSSQGIIFDDDSTEGRLSVATDLYGLNSTGLDYRQSQQSQSRFAGSSNSEQLTPLSATTSSASWHCLGDRLKSLWMTVPAKTAGAVCMYRGLRVRLGMHSGVESAAEINYNSTMTRYHYSGTLRRMAQAVASTGRGGDISISNSTAALLDPGGGVMTDLPLGNHVYYGGHHVLKDVKEDSFDLFLVVPASLSCRLQVWHIAPKSENCIVPSIAAAPCTGGELGCPTLVCLNLSSLDVLLAWNQSITLDALKCTWRHTLNAASSSGGVVSEDGISMILQVPERWKTKLGASKTNASQMIVAFHEPQDALEFALDVRDGLLSLDWSQDLLQHELCEPVGEERQPRGGPVLAADQTSLGDRQPSSAAPELGPSFSVADSPSHRLMMLASTMSQGASGALAAQPSDAVVIAATRLRGLRVRLALHSGKFKMHLDLTGSGRVLYTGKARKQLDSLKQQGKQGQILVHCSVAKQLNLPACPM